MSLKVFGLTGNIGTGKSTVGARFRQRGLPVVDADLLARLALEPGQPAFRQVLDAFGPDLLDARGHIDRKRLAERVFSDQQARHELEAIVHPEVQALARQRWAELEAQGKKLACYEAPLLVEAGLAEGLRPLVVVVTSEDTALRRAGARDRVDLDQVRARLRAQMPISEKARRADYVIDNEGPLAKTLEQADQVLDQICDRLGVPRCAE